MATYKSIKYIVPVEVVEHTDSINALADVDTSTVAPEVGQTLKWVGNSKWKPRDIDSTNQAPVMSSTTPVSIAESTVTGRAVSTISATDPEGDTLTYSILSGNTGNAFTINPSTGAITTATALDYETTNSYTLTVAATDTVINRAITTQIVNVTDNSNPVISNTSSVSFVETVSIGTAVATISASDLENDTITYSITAGNVYPNEKFTINSSTGAITTIAEFDYYVYDATRNIYTLTITASDSAGEIGTATQTVNITSNQAPVISDTSVVSILEDASIGTVVATISATDDEAITFSITAGNTGNAFTINASTGVITTTATLDYETTTSYILTVAVTDTSGLISTITQTINVTDVVDALPNATGKAIFGFGWYSSSGTKTSITNLVSTAGVVATDTAGVGKTRSGLAAAGYGGDKAIFGFGIHNTGFPYENITNLVSNAGVVATDTTGVGTARFDLTASSYGNGKAIFAYGDGGGYNAHFSNLVNNSGVVASDTTGVGTDRSSLAATGYGGDKAIFGFGAIASSPYRTNVTNLVSNAGVIASDTTGVGTARSSLAAAGYGSTGQAIFGFGSNSNGTNLTNLVSNTGVVATDTTGVGTYRYKLAAAGYGGDKAIFGFGRYYTNTTIWTNVTNLVSNTGVVSSDQTGVGTGRTDLAAAGF